MAAAGLLLVLARARAGTAACPACGSVSGRVHSRYVRRLADAAIGGRRVVIQPTVRRLFCADPGCKRRTFAEQIPGLTVRYARKTPPLRGMLGDIAVALAGRAASRLAAALGMPASRQVLLRRERAWELDGAAALSQRPGAGRLLGWRAACIDQWAAGVQCERGLAAVSAGTGESGGDAQGLILRAGRRERPWRLQSAGVALSEITRGAVLKLSGSATVWGARPLGQAAPGA
jgi:zinc-finger of transposase IS204/IS1001/IS1096/IS1165